MAQDDGLLDVEDGLLDVEPRSTWPDIFSQIDENGDGVADRIEYMVFTRDSLIDRGRDSKELRDEVYSYAGVLYDKVDVNGDGVLDRREVQFGQHIALADAARVLRGDYGDGPMDLGEAENLAQHRSLDANGDGKIDQQELKALWSRGFPSLGLRDDMPEALESASLAGAVLAQADFDRDGAIAPRELEFANFVLADAVMSASVSELFGAVDRDLDGRISKRELERYLAYNRHRGPSACATVRKAFEMFPEFDTDADGFLSWHEASDFVSDLQEGLRQR